jgi:uncharacterized membrane protein
MSDTEDPATRGLPPGAYGPPPRLRLGLGARLRNYFLTGVVIAAPVAITIYITWWIVALVDRWVKPLIPSRYNPDYYLPFTVPGFGLVIAILAITLLGFFAANLFGRTIVSYGEMLLNRMPFIRSLYRGLKQIFETVLSQSAASFNEVGVIEYPRRGLYSLVFVATDTKGEIAARLDEGDGLVSVFLPTTPNPTSGFLLFVPRRDVLILDMSVEEAAKLVISAGLVTPEYQEQTKALAANARAAIPPAAAE